MPTKPRNGFEPRIALSEAMFRSTTWIRIWVQRKSRTYLGVSPTVFTANAPLENVPSGTCCSGFLREGADCMAAVGIARA